MSAAVIASIVGGLCTIAASLLTVYMKRRFDAKDRHALSDARRRRVEGRWTGTFRQRRSSTPPTVEASDEASGDETSSDEWSRLRLSETEFNFTYDQRRLTGHGWFQSSTGRKDFRVEGEFYDEHYLNVAYVNREDGVKQYGVAILRLSSDCQSLTGQFVGYGINTEAVISGYLDLTNSNGQG